MLTLTARFFRDRTVPAIIILLCLAAGAAYSGITGKLVGKITDIETGKPVVNANILEVNQKFGGSTDLDGDFFILNIPPGVYEIEVSCLNYHTITIEGIEIHADLTTEQDIELTGEAYQLKEVRVIAVRKLVEVDKVLRETRFSKEAITNLRPEEVTTLLKSTVGFKEDEEGRFHVRGSRAGEVAFIVDGVDLRDPLVSTGITVALGAENVEEVNILTGGFSAEYGKAMGAIVQVTTAEGSEKGYSGRIEYQTDRIIDTYSFDTDRGEVSFEGPVPGSEKIFKRPVTFYLTTIGKLTNTYVPFDINRPANDYLGIGINLPERQENSFQTSLKLAYKLTDKKKLTLNLKHAYKLWDIYPTGEGGISGNYGYQYKYNPDNRPWAENRQYTGTLTFTNQLSQFTFYELKLITFRTHSTVQPRSKNPGEFTLLDDIEDDFAAAFDRNKNNWFDVDEYSDTDGNGFMDGYVDANNNGIFDGGGEGYEDRNYNGQWDRGEDWVDLNGNGVYDAAEPWIDVVNPLTGENYLGVYDPWDSFSDVNGNGRWDPAEPLLPEHDRNGNDVWDGERFIDANNNGKYDPWEPWEDLNGNFLWDEGEPFIDTNGNGRFDYGEGYDDKNRNGRIDRRDMLPYEYGEGDRPEPFIDGDFFWNTGEPFIDQPDVITGEYNGRWDYNDRNGNGRYDPGEPGLEIYYDLNRNGAYDGPNYSLVGEPIFDFYELFCRPANCQIDSDPSRPVIFTLESEEWPEDLFAYHPGKSTWINRTLHDIDNPRFDPPNGIADIDKEWWLDYNNNGSWEREGKHDGFLNPGMWDGTVYWQDRVSTEYTVKFDITSQISKFHEVKSGAEINFRDLKMQSIEEPDLLYTGDAELLPGSPWPDRGGVRDFYHYKPIEGAVYAQDKMEFEGLIIQAGLRGDFTIHDREAVDEFRARVERDEPGAIYAERGKWYISPRLGISHPITERSQLYFNYGHFYQRPSFSYFYRSTTANIESNSIIGNPNLEYEKTIQYELGLNNQVSEFVVVKIAGYYKDQYNLVGTSDERWKNINLDRYVNLGYGRMRGFELSIDKVPFHNWSFNFNYDFSYAYGKESEQHANQDTRLKNQPYNWDEHPLDWDETHTVNSAFTLNYGPGDHMRVLGLVLPDEWRATLQWEFGSGLPYTPSKYLVGIDDENLILPNSARRPWHELTTLKLEKYYTLNERTQLLFGFTISNLFNRRNVYGVYDATGTPDKAVNPLDPTYNPNANREDWDANPRNWSAPRNALFRVGLRF